MSREYTTRDTTPQNSGHPTPNKVHTFWRNSVLVGPQTAGIPTIHNEDEGANESATFGSDSHFQPPPSAEDITGGTLEYHRSQRKGR